MAGRRKVFKNPLSSLAIFTLFLHSSYSYYYPDVGPYPENQLFLYNRHNGFIHSKARHVESESETEYFDLSYTYDNNTIFYPEQSFDFELYRDVGPTVNYTVDGHYKYSYASWSFCMSEHGGTHLDAPFHFNRYGWRLNEIPLKRLVDVPAVVVDVEKHVFALKKPDEFVLQVEHWEEHEAHYGPIPQGAVVIVRFGWGQFWTDKLRYTGWNNRTAAARPTLHFPGIGGEATAWLLKHRHPVGVGTDTMSADIGNEGGNPVAHILLLEAQVYIIENVAYLEHMLHRIRSRSYPQGCNLRIFVLPIKSGGTGGPTRLLAYCKQY